MYVPMPIHCKGTYVYACITGSGCSSNEMCNSSDSFCDNLALRKVYYQVFINRPLHRQYGTIIENSHHSLYAQKDMIYRAHNSYSSQNQITVIALFIRPPIIDILCTLHILSVSKCNIHFSKQHRVY